MPTKRHLRKEVYETAGSSYPLGLARVLPSWGFTNKAFWIPEINPILRFIVEECRAGSTSSSSDAAIHGTSKDVLVQVVLKIDGEHRGLPGLGCYPAPPVIVAGHDTDSADDNDNFSKCRKAKVTAISQRIECSL
ncbi:hypothetical protein LIA77_06363 [Sarocladium implicatum]|nr:hypothetical protein LIA77_06363 [Sarocladium implicatum]